MAVLISILAFITVGYIVLLIQFEEAPESENLSRKQNISGKQKDCNL